MASAEPLGEGAGAQPSAARVGRNAAYLVAAQAVTTAVAIVYSATLARRLGTSEYGVYFLVSTMAAFSFVVSEWGGGLLVIREVARRPERAGVLLGSALAVRAVGALAVMLPTAGVAWALGYGARVRWLALACIASGLPLSLAQAFGMVFRSRDRMGPDATVAVSNKLGTVALAVPALALGLGIPGVLAAQALAGVAALAAAAWFYRRLGAPRLAASAAGAREVLAGNVPLLALAIANAVQPYLDVIVLSKLASPAAVGWFGAARNVMGTVLAPAGILASATYPGLSRAADGPALAGALRSALRPALWLGALAATGTWLFGDVAIALIFGREAFGPSAPILRAFAPGLFLMFVDVLLGHVAVACGRARHFAVLKAAGIAASLALCFALIPAFEARTGNGGMGVVLAFVASELLVFAGAIALVPRRALDRALAGDAARALASGGVTLVLFALAPALSPLLGIPLCVLSFVVASIGTGLLRRGDLDALRAALRARGRAPPTTGSPEPSP